MLKFKIFPFQKGKLQKKKKKKSQDHTVSIIALAFLGTDFFFFSVFLSFYMFSFLCPR